MLSVNESIQTLKNIAAVFQKEETDFIELSEVIRNYESLVLELSDLNMDEETNRSDIHFKNGKALGTTWAAMCIRDLMRTKIFIKGLFKAIGFIQKTKQGTLQIIYAGTGPFATLALPVMACFSPDEVQFTLLEINRASFENVKKVIQKLGFEKHVQSYVLEDATKYRVNKEIQYDIVLSETMQRALEREQQVPIVMNIIGQLNSNVVLIPENIRLDLCMLNLKKLHQRKLGEEEDCIFRLGTIFELSREKIKEYIQESQTKKGKLVFSAKSFKIPKERIVDFNTLAVITEIQVFGEEKIKMYESGLTLPLILEDLPEQLHNSRVNAFYKVDEIPGIEYQLNP
jgi:hypothetical protein